jgi:hypothetical protein
MNKISKISGLGLFTIGFIVFILSLTLSDYKLTENIAKSQGEGEKYEVLQEALSPMTGKIYPSNFAFISDLRRSIKITNIALIEKYTISEAVSDEIVDAARDGDTYVFSQTESSTRLSPIITKFPNTRIRA